MKPRNLALLGLCAIALLFTAMAGCSFLDGFLGVDPVTGQAVPGPSTAEKLAGPISLWFPIAGMIATTAAAIWQKIRANKEAALKEQISAGGQEAWARLQPLLDTNKDGKVDANEVLAAIGPFFALFKK